MKRKLGFRRILSMALAAVLCLGALPRAASAEDAAVFTRIRSAGELVTGCYVLVVSSGYAPLSYDGGGISAARPEMEDDTLTDARDALWRITVCENGVILTDSAGISVAPGTEGLTAGEYIWAVDCADGRFTFSGQGEDDAVLAFDGESARFCLRPKESGAEGFALYALQEAAPGDTVEPAPEPASHEKPETDKYPDEPEDAPQADVVASPKGRGLYFGQLHSHTDFSDGTGTVEEAFAYASGVENMDFLAVTDHSNSFDNDTLGAIGSDGALVSSEWARGKQAAQDATTEDFVAIFGYEMTWHTGMGLGHINTFGTPGFQSRNQSEFSSYSTALQNYYQALTTVPGSVSQFNHPGTTYGDFCDFAYYSEAADARITLLEVGCGGYTAYDYYTRALDQGWHVAPTNNQDNHNGMWGSADSGRTVVLADSLTEAGIYDALANYRVYATEDCDLSIDYTLDGYAMGSLLDRQDVGDTVRARVGLSDPTDGAPAKVEVIADGGQVIAARDAVPEAAEFQVSSEYRYYYIRVTQADGDIAVTAPVWIRQTESVSISAFTADTLLPVQGRELNLTLELSNSGQSDLLVEKIEFLVGGEVIHTATEIERVGRKDTASYTFPFTYSGLGYTEICAVVTGSLNGSARVYTETLTLRYASPEMEARIVVDGSHADAASLKRLISLAAGAQIDVTVAAGGVTAEMLENCSLLIVFAPAGDSGGAAFEDGFLQLVSDYGKNGGSVVVCGAADSGDGESEASLHAAAQLNRLLAALGCTMRLEDDTAWDEVNNGGTPERLYLAKFNTASPWCTGVNENQTYSQQSGCTVSVGGGTWLVKGYGSTVSVDADGDGLGGSSGGGAVVLACEETAWGGTVFVSGGAFLADGELREPGTPEGLTSANLTILENILGVTRVELPLKTIQEARQGTAEAVFRVRGYVTAGTSNPYNTFPDTIYIQDSTGGIAVTPFSLPGVELGAPVEIIGYPDASRGEIQLQVISYEMLNKVFYRYEPKKLSAGSAMDYAAHGGELIQVEGQVTEVTLSGTSGVSRFVLRDKQGNLARVEIEDAILSGTTGKNTLASIVKVGSTVRAVGLLYLHPGGDSGEPYPALRVRDCDEVISVPKPDTGGNPDTGDGGILFFAAVLLGSAAALKALLPRRKRIG